MRCISSQVVVALSGAGLALIASWYLIPKLGVVGAAWAMAITSWGTMIGMALLFFVVWRKQAWC